MGEESGGRIGLRVDLGDDETRSVLVQELARELAACGGLSDATRAVLSIAERTSAAGVDSREIADAIAPVIAPQEALLDAKQSRIRLRVSERQFLRLREDPDFPQPDAIRGKKRYWFVAKLDRYGRTDT